MTAPLTCPVCKGIIDVRIAQGRKSKKHSLHPICPVDGRHYRAFIHDEEFVARVIAESPHGRDQIPDQDAAT